MNFKKGMRWGIVGATVTFFSNSPHEFMLFKNKEQKEEYSSRIEHPPRQRKDTENTPFCYCNYSVLYAPDNPCFYQCGKRKIE